MVLPRFFVVENLDDFLEYCSYVKVILYQEEEQEKGCTYYWLLAGRLYWEGTVCQDDQIWQQLMNLLAIKGIRVTKVIDLDTLAVKFG